MVRETSTLHLKFTLILDIVEVGLKMTTIAIWSLNFVVLTGRLKFSNGLLTSSLTSSTNMISDIDMSDLSTNAWYYNESATISASMIFDSSVTMKVCIYTLEYLNCRTCTPY